MTVAIDARRPEDCRRQRAWTVPARIHVYSYEFATALPDKIKGIMAKVVSDRRSAMSVAALKSYHKEGVKRISKVDLPQGPVYAVAFRPDARVLAVAGGDGKVRLLDPEDGALVKVFSPAPLSEGSTAVAAPATRPVVPRPEEPIETETLPGGSKLVALEVQPAAIRLSGRFAYAQVLVTGRLVSGGRIDVTRMVEPAFSADVATISRSGLVTPRGDGRAAAPALAGRPGRPRSP